MNSTRASVNFVENSIHIGRTPSARVPTTKLASAFRQATYLCIVYSNILKQLPILDLFNAAAVTYIPKPTRVRIVTADFASKSDVVP